MPASYKTCPPYPAGVVYSLLIGPKTIGLTALTLSLAHAPNRETLSPFKFFFQLKEMADKKFHLLSVKSQLSKGSGCMKHGLNISL